MSSQSNQKDQNISQFNKFLQNNHDFLQQKYDEYFKKTSMPTKDVNRQSAVKYIYDVFSFNKYESDQKMNTTLQKSLLKNIQDFIAGLNKKKMPFNYKTAVELLKFCIENNEMFAVKYDKKDKKMKTEEPMNESTFTEKQQGGARDNKETQKVEQQQSNNEQENEQQKQNEESNENKSENMEQNPNHVNQFAESQKQSPEKVADPELIKKNLKQMFQFYCKQQQNVGVNTTFDRISYQCKTMTLGKFLAFANSTEIVNDKVDKNLLMRKFKLVAQGKKQIQFQHFYDIMKTLAGIDQAMIPKLGVDQKINFKAKLKERSMAFNTKDLTSRDIKRDYIPKLTGHSGKLSDALYEQMRLRKQQKIQQSSFSHSKQNLNEQNTIKTPVPNNRYDSSIKSQLKQGSQIISSPNQLTNSNIRDFEEDLGFLEKMINVQETDQQWLKQYRIPHKKIVNPLPPRLMSRKESIVPNLKKRVEELERSETRQTTHLQRRQFMSNNRQRQRERNSKSILN